MGLQAVGFCVPYQLCTQAPLIVGVQSISSEWVPNPSHPNQGPVTLTSPNLVPRGRVRFRARVRDLEDCVLEYCVVEDCAEVFYHVLDKHYCTALTPET